LIHDSPEKVDQFFRRFEARTFSGHQVLCSPGETGWPWFCGVVKLNDEDQIQRVLRRPIGFHDSFLPFRLDPWSFVALAFQYVPRIELKGHFDP
jgi:hypothetical protein